MMEGESSVDTKLGVNSSAGITKESYHHGELPQTLMTLALQHIKAVGTEKLSLRALAREAGVSPTAPYKHFASKQCLFAALATQGFHDLATRTHACAAGGLPLDERLIAMGLAYLRFAQENPTTYHLMFGSVLADFSEYDMLHRAAVNSYDEVHLVLAELVADKNLNVDVAQLGGVVWSLVHGMASLLVDELNIGAQDSRPMQAIMAIKKDPQSVLGFVFDNLLRS